MSAMPVSPDAAFPGPPSLAPPGYAPMPAYGQNPMYAQRQWREDNGFIHFLRFLLIWFAMAALFYVIVGFVWLAFALAATGRRKRDLLMMFIPVWSTVVFIQTVWRYTAKNVYWSVRPDTISKSLFSA